MDDETSNALAGDEALEYVAEVLADEESIPSQARGLPNTEDACRTYQEVRPYIDKCLWAIELIPGYGPKIVTTMRFLRRVADMACPNTIGGGDA